MTGWDIVSLIVLVAIAWFFLRVQLAERFEAVRGRRTSASPRSLHESGGYVTQRPTRSQMERNAPPERHDVNNRRRRREESPPARPARGRNTEIGARVQQQLRSPESAKMAFVMREVLDTPVGMRDEERM